jgi:hypothetical protein
LLSTAASFSREKFRSYGLDSSGDLSCPMAHSFDVVAVGIEDISAVVG